MFCLLVKGGNYPWKPLSWLPIIPKYYLAWISQRFNNILVIFYVVCYLQLKAIVLIKDYNSIEPLVLGLMTVCVLASLSNSLTFPLLVFSLSSVYI